VKLLIWQWGRRGAGPRYAAWLAGALRGTAHDPVALSLSEQSELLRAPDGPVCELPFPTYDGLGGFALQWALSPVRIHRLALRVAALRPDVALCAMPAPLDLLMAAALRRVGIPFAVVVHDAEVHPGDGLPLQMTLQRALMHRADALVVLTGHVADRLRANGLVDGPTGKRRLIRSRLPPFVFGPPPPAPRSQGGKLRLLSFGRLLPYKGLDLLAGAMRLLGPRGDFELRVVGSGPEMPELAELRALPGVTVENRWVPEGEIAGLLAWADAVVLSHREASQSGAAAAAIAARRYVVATCVGGIAEQLAGNPLARLCQPTAEGLAAALTELLAAPPPAPCSSSTKPVPVDPAVLWRETALALMEELAPLRK
jgi:glycosyltransferase involved in cell wall biosynthesis